MLNKKDLLKLMGENIRKARMDKELSQEELGSAIGYTSAGICQIERGKRDCGVYSIYQICKRLSITPTKLLGYVILPDR